MLKTTFAMCLLVLVATSTMLAADPIPGLGTWKLDTAKSKWDPGPAPKSSTRVVSQDGDWIVIETNTVSADGKPKNRVFRYKQDGNEYPWGSGWCAVSRIDAYREEWVFRSETSTGKGHTVISKDGKTMTETFTGASDKGQKSHYVKVYDKQ